MSAIVTGTMIYFGAGIVINGVTYLIPACRSDQGLTNLLVWLTVCCCWLMWVITYMMQLNPLVAPIPLAE